MAGIDDLSAGVAARRAAWLAALEDAGLAAPTIEGYADALARAFEASDYLAQAAIRHPELLPRLAAAGRLTSPSPPGDLDRRLAAALADVPDEASLGTALRRFRRTEMVRIIWRDLGGLAPLVEVLEDLTALADACVAQALERLRIWAETELGTPRDAHGRPQRLVVLGMGKLGARELNLSSDIDLIFAFPASGATDGPRPIGNEQFFVRLARRLVQALDAQTAEGFVFRVDTRLRPFGDAGPLAMSFGAMEEYYQSQARPWERYAMIKARVVAGDAEAGADLMAMLRPFVYRRYLDFSAIEALREMKGMIARELQRKGMAHNIKLGPGGIREVEFIGQAFQLIRGGRDPDLQIRPILPVLRLLGQKGLMPRFAVDELSRAYEVLRRVENRIQAWKDQQTHLLPSDELGRLRLARAMGFADWERFLAVLDEHRRRVQGHFDLVFASPQADDERQAEPPLAALWAGHTDAEQACAVLGDAGFAAPRAAYERLQHLREAAARKGLSTRGAERLGQLIPLLLQVVAASGHPDLALKRVLPLIESVSRRTAYLAMLLEHPLALSQLVRLSGMSPWIAEQLGRQPLLLDELLDPRRLFAPLRRADLEEELDSLLAPVEAEDLEQQMERLRQFAQGNRLRVAAADLTGVIPLMVVSDYLTEIAEVTVRRVLRIAFDHLVRRHGRPPGVAADDLGFLVLGYGKLGGIELGYGSDLDLVFLHGGKSVSAMTAGPHAISTEQIYARLGQRMLHMMTTRTNSGALYEIDMRLRPDGNKGLLVRSFDAFAAYQSKDAWTWEHQALVRARPIAGDAALAEHFAAVRREILCRERDPQTLRREVREMRARMRRELDKGRAGRFDLKQGRGGIADIEFMVQYAVLRWASAHPDLADWTDNIRLLETLSRHALLPGDAAAELTFAYKALRAAYHRSALQEEPTVVPDGELRVERERVAELWNQLMEG
ncbi:MAG: bifunctional [glutamate--ammonia ligase]-adenylyl-L-tyrosine phosphorylase/[glutamate--ammonia-ligase] adenylyltransferase [Chromatiaceae bacterium]|jgi:glutamate-ammonia-ligase adenylyltransferase|nr:bifunctional [glutamate--ammonia ligase]-adenylyl-L-tyrosine phosphorylase/[glutamate--ammonia-ligase] adenylyltransferase [Chromatiaceae bacterium]